MSFLLPAGVWVGASVLIYAGLYGKKTDRYKIEQTFKNTAFHLRDKYPRHLYTRSKASVSYYGYTVPYGLIGDDKLAMTLSKTINRRVTVGMFRGHLKITVYKEELRRMYKYDWRKTKEIPIGVSHEGEVLHDFDKIPHMTIAGMTRYGKTQLLKLLFAHLVNNNEDAAIHIIDLKGGLEFGRYENIKQVREIADDLPSANIMLDNILRKMDKHIREFRRKGISNIVETGIKRRTYAIVDEAGDLDDDARFKLSRLARIGGAIGYRLIFATQYPTADTLPRQIKQNADAKVSFRLPTNVASRVAIDEGGAEDLSEPGRAIYRSSRRIEMQVPYVSDKEIENKLRRFMRNDYGNDESTSEGEERRADSITFE